MPLSRNSCIVLTLSSCWKDNRCGLPVEPQRIGSPNKSLCSQRRTLYSVMFGCKIRAISGTVYTPSPRAMSVPLRSLIYSSDCLTNSLLRTQYTRVQFSSIVHQYTFVKATCSCIMVGATTNIYSQDVIQSFTVEIYLPLIILWGSNLHSRMEPELIVCFESSSRTKTQLDSLIESGQYKDYSEAISSALENLIVLQNELSGKGALIIESRKESISLRSQPKSGRSSKRGKAAQRTKEATTKENLESEAFLR